MTITVEGLPNNQKIKHINVDISFDDDGVEEVKTVIKPNAPVVVVPNKNDSVDDTGVKIDKPTIDISGRVASDAIVEESF